ncbi:LEPR-XLL domain-containing protein [Halapricum desulfuricans]
MSGVSERAEPRVLLSASPMSSCHALSWRVLR